MASPLCLVFVAVAMIAVAVSGNGVPVYVMMPLNTVNPDCTLNDPQLIYQQLQVSSAIVVNVSMTNNISSFRSDSEKRRRDGHHEVCFVVVASIAIRIDLD